MSRVFGDSIIISHSFEFVKGFSKSFLKIFEAFRLTLAKCPTIISHSLDFVKRFLESFSNFFVIFRPRFAFAKQPDYYITSSRFCQEVFEKFFKLFRDLSGLSTHLAQGVSR